MKSIIVVILLSISSTALSGVHKTFYVKILGDQKTGAKLMDKLTEKKCHTLGTESCHTFKKFESDNQIKGDFSSPEASLLYQVNITHRGGVGRYNLQIFQMDGKTLRRVRNGGNFTPAEFEGHRNKPMTKEIFFNQLVKTTISMSFK
ncbi:MAG: hypothetical protein V4598_07945 [Bdellovibrionota bacterium]